MTLRVEHSRWDVQLAFAVRFVDHFLGIPVNEDLAVHLAGGTIRPVPALDGGSRHADGSYRFVDLAAGTYPLELSVPSGRWRSLEPPLAVTVPGASPAVAIERQLWPTPRADAPPSVTTIRGRLQGPAIAGLDVVIRPVGGSTTRFNRADDEGEFVFPVLGRATPIVGGPDEGRVQLEIEVAGGARAVTGGAILEGSSWQPFGGSTFTVWPGRSNRLTFSVAP